MIIGHGIDIVDLTRFQNMKSDRLLRLAFRICTDTELTEFKNNNVKYKYLAKIWAVKESVSKAFGTGIRGDTTWKNMEVRSSTLGRPQIYLKSPLHKPGLFYHTSVSHDGDYLIASTILEFNDC